MCVWLLEVACGAGQDGGTAAMKRFQKKQSKRLQRLGKAAAIQPHQRTQPAAIEDAGVLPPPSAPQRTDEKSNKGKDTPPPPLPPPPELASSADKGATTDRRRGVRRRRALGPVGITYGCAAQLVRTVLGSPLAVA